MVSTSTVSYVGADDAICGGTVNDDGGAEITARGVCWSTNPEPTLGGAHTVDSCGLGQYVSHITNLALNTKYYVRAYATNSQGTGYGSEFEFTTTALSPTVVTTRVSDIESVSARVLGEVTANGGSEVTERGVCWSTHEGPTIQDQTMAAGSGIGIFACDLINLTPNTTYHVRAYAKNNVGTSYGNVVIFTTLNLVGDTFFEDFEAGTLGIFTKIDADGDGYTWRSNTEMSGLTGGHNGSANFVLSQSYDNISGILYPDNYLVSPQSNITTGSTFSFWACAQDSSYPSEHFGVAISTTTPTADAFTTIVEWTMIFKEVAAASACMSKNGKGTREGTWYKMTVDLSAYAGQKVYIAIRHFNCSDEFYLDVDDVELSIEK